MVAINHSDIKHFDSEGSYLHCFLQVVERYFLLVFFIQICLQLRAISSLQSLLTFHKTLLNSS